MLKRNKFYIILIVLGIIIGFLTYYHLVIGIALFLVILAIVFFGIFNIRASIFIESICRVKTTEKIVFLTFDDGPCEPYTNSILDTLREHDIKSTFFCIGENAEKNKQTLLRIDKEGHIIGSHTYTHQWKYTFSANKKVQNEIKLGNETIMKIIGKKPRLFRPPFGITNPIIAHVIELLNMNSIGWSIRSYDTLHNDHEKLLTRIVSQLKPGAIILLHDRLPITAEILPRLINQIYERGYKILPLQQFLTTSCYE
jgi:peptidoglycan/xylan/chitin deacetylase (PgdA/CDA1 family)